MGEKYYRFIRGIAAEAELVVRVLTPRNIASRCMEVKDCLVNTWFTQLWGVCI